MRLHIAAARRFGQFVLLLCAGAVVGVGLESNAYGQVAPIAVRTGHFQWDSSRQFLQLSVSFRDVATPEIIRKLKLGLPTTIVLTGVLRAGQRSVGTTFQRCKITWHVWEEMYRVEVSRSMQPLLKRSWSPSVNGVLRRCAEADRLIVAQRSQVPSGQPLALQARVLVNPLSPQLLEKIKRWISRPSSAATATSASKLISTFTGLFMTRVGEAEAELKFVTRPSVPPVFELPGSSHTDTSTGSQSR